MKKTRLSILSIVSLLSLVGCGEATNNNGNNNNGNNTGGEVEIKHNFSDKYKYDSTKHWQPCLDEECEGMQNEGEHVFGSWIYDSYLTTTGGFYGWGGTTTPGQRHKTCNVCGYNVSEEHNYTEADVHECEFETGWTSDASKHWHKCTKTVGGNPCEERDAEAIHTFGEWIIDNYADITHDAAGADDVINKIGNKHRVCSICNYTDRTTHTEEEPLPEHTHTFDNNWQSDDSYHWHQCSYGKKTGYGGRDMYVCKEVKDKVAHTWDAGTITKAPTTSSEGIKTYTCSICKATKQENIAPVVDNTDGSEVITVNFAKLEGKQAATVNPKTKKYIDDMKAAEKLLADPYKMQDLDNGIDVSKYLSKDDFKDSAGQGHNKPDGVTLSWEKGSMDYTSATIKYATKADMSDALEVATSGTSVNIKNLYSNTKYFYQLSYVKGTTLYKSNIASFETADYTRFIDMGLVYNVRDMGNYKTSDGGRVRQGLVYRGSELTPKAYSDNNGSHPKNIDNEVLQLQDNVLKIAIEIDHRSADEAQRLTTSPITTTAHPVQYKREGYKVSAYTNFLNAGNTEIQNIYKAFAEADTKHVYYHCIGGADRTGCVGFVLLGLLGVSYTDAIIDFEVTTATNYPRSRYFNHPEGPYYSQFPNFYNAFVKASWYNAGKSFKENCEAFLKSKGVTDATISKIREVMIEK